PEGGDPLPAELTTQGGSGSYTWGPTGLTAGETYTLSETEQGDWVSTFESCIGVTPTSHTDTSVTFVAGAGAEISCSFTNTKRPQIIVQKTATGDGGEFGFTLTPTDPAGDPVS